MVAGRLFSCRQFHFSGLYHPALSPHHFTASPGIVRQIRKRDGKLEVWTFILENEYDYYRKYLGLRGHAYNLNPHPSGFSAPPPQ